MKKLFLLSAAMMLFVSCASVQLPAPRSATSLMDYSPLTSNGIFVTESNSVSFEYEPIGSVVAVAYGGWGKLESQKAGKDDSYVSTSGKTVYFDPSLSDAYESLKSKLFEIGANGIINLKATFTPGDPSRYVVGTITLSGMAIAR